MAQPDLEARLARATEVMRNAGDLALRYFEAREELLVENKGFQDVVSKADREVEELIREQIGAAFPEDAFLGEEHGGDDSASLLWVIDPIDGTANFLRGMPYWSCVLAFTVDGRTELGLTMDPVHGELWSARRGRGAWRDGKRIEANLAATPAFACIGLSYSFKTEGEEYRHLIDGLLRERLDHRRSGSSALALCHVADGRLEGFVAMRNYSWDVLAGLITAEEAGCIATRYTDDCSLLEPRSVAAAVPSIAPALERASGVALKPAR